MIIFFNPEHIQLGLTTLRNVFASFQLTKSSTSSCGFETLSEVSFPHFLYVYTLLSIIVYSSEVISHRVKLHVGK